jgi:hypothetical protein
MKSMRKILTLILFLMGISFFQHSQAFEMGVCRGVSYEKPCHYKVEDIVFNVFHYGKITSSYDGKILEIQLQLPRHC